MRRVALELVPARHRALVELLAAADDLDRAARRAVVDRQRQAPVALLADHPVVHVAQPVELALVAEVRDPADLVDDVHDLVAQARVDLFLGQRLARLVVQRSHADEPLVDEAEDERRPAPPAVRVAVVDRLEPVEAALALEVLDDRVGHVAHVAPRQRAEPADEDAALVERGDDRQPERLAELEVLGAAARGDVDDAGPLVLADVGPRHDPVLVGRVRGVGRAGGEGLPDSRQVVERPVIAPADHVRSGDLVEHLERTGERGLEGPLPQPVDPVTLADLDVADGRADGGSHVRGQRPGRRRPDQQRFARPVAERERDRQPRVVPVLVALVHLGLRDARPAPRAPRHRVVALVDPAAPVALGQEAPDQVVVLVAEREVAAPDVLRPEPPDEHLDGVGDRAAGALDGGDGGRLRPEQLAQPAQLVGVVPVHPHPEPDRLLGLAGGVGQDALLAQRHEAGDPERLDVALGGEAELALDVDLDPQALAVEPVLVALVLAQHGVKALVEVLVGAAPGVMDAHRVVGGDRAVEEAPLRAVRVLGAQPRERPPLAPQIQDLVLLGDKVGLRVDGSEHSASGVGWVAHPAPGAVRVRFGGSEYPTRDART